MNIAGQNISPRLVLKADIRTRTRKTAPPGMRYKTGRMLNSDSAVLVKAYANASSRQVPEFAAKTIFFADSFDSESASLEAERDTGNCFMAYAVADSDITLTRDRNRSFKVVDMDSIDGMNAIVDNRGTTVKIVYEWI